MALKSKQPTAEASQGGEKTIPSFPGKMTIESRLVKKALVADTRTFMTKSLGQLTREKRHKLLYGD